MSKKGNRQTHTYTPALSHFLDAIIDGWQPFIFTANNQAELAHHCNFYIMNDEATIVMLERPISGSHLLYQWGLVTLVKKINLFLGSQSAVRETGSIFCPLPQTERGGVWRGEQEWYK